MSSQPDLTIIIPAYNEARRIGESLEQLAAFLGKHTDRLGVVEVVVVAAKSRDKTPEIAQSKSHLFKHFRVINAGLHGGKGRDVRLAMLETTGKYRIFMDADLATPLAHLLDVQGEIANNADVIIGVRNLSLSHKGLRKFISNFGNILVRVLLGLKINDTQCGFKAFRGAVAEDLFAKQRIMGWGFDMEILAIAKKRGLRIVSIPVPDWKDVAGGSFKNVAVTGAISTFKDLLKIKWNLISGKYK